jgi:hypothetical protein
MEQRYVRSLPRIVCPWTHFDDRFQIGVEFIRIAYLITRKQKVAKSYRRYVQRVARHEAKQAGTDRR